MTPEESLSIEVGEYRPLPEVLGGDWEVGPGPGRAVRNGRGLGGVLHAPMGASDLDRVMRAKAMLSGALSPQQWRNLPKGLNPEYVEVAESARTMMRLQTEWFRVFPSGNTTEPYSINPYTYREEAAEIVGNRMAFHLQQGDIETMVTTLFEHPEVAQYIQMPLETGPAGSYWEVEGMLADGMDEHEIEEGYGQEMLDGWERVKEMPAEQRERYLKLAKTFDKLQIAFVGSTYELSPHDHRSSVRYAESIARAIEQFRNGAASASDSKKDASDHAVEQAMGDQEPKTSKTEEPSEAIKEKLAEEFDEDMKEVEPYFRLEDTHCEWLPMEIANPYRDRALPALLSGPTTTYSDRGSIPRAMHRWCSDKMIFTTKVRRKGGSVLIDLSGSMSLSSEDIWELMQTIPAGIMAAYSCAAVEGTLRILAKNGRCVEDEASFRYDLETNKYYGGGNGVDGLALRWLGKQAFPRIWVSDGLVTGVSPHGEQLHAKNLLEDATTVAKRHAIKRVPNIEAARHYMENSR